ncbi:MAG: type IV pilin [Methanomicrobium sp.]|nr:type IV pilin [Methanomicrobium sp.]
MHKIQDKQNASSPVIAVILLVLITIILALIVYLILMNFNVSLYKPPEETPTIFKIIKVSSSSPNYESVITLRNVGLKSYNNSLLTADIYSNDVLLGCRIYTMNGKEFIPTHHYFVKTLGGSGCSDADWYMGQKTAIDITDGLIKPGDTVKVDIFLKPEMRIISTDTFKFPG